MPLPCDFSVLWACTNSLLYLRAGDKINSIEGGAWLVDLSTESVNRLLRDFEQNKRSPNYDQIVHLDREIEISRKRGDSWGITVSFDESRKVVSVQSIEVKAYTLAGELLKGDLINGYNSMDEFTDAISNVDTIKLKVSRNILMIPRAK